MADAKQPKTVKVTYVGNNPIPNGVIGGVIPENGETYEVKASLWEKKKGGSSDWKEVKAPAKKKAKKNSSTEKSSND